MGKATFYDANGLKKGAWSEDEDNKLKAYIQRYGHWNWGLLPQFAGVSRSGKSCRLRWMNYLRPNIKHGHFTQEEDNIIIDLHNELGNKWSTIAAKLPGRSDNEIKNRWNTHLKKRTQNGLHVTIKGRNVGIFHHNQPNPKENHVQETKLEVKEELEMLLNEVSSESPSSSPSRSSCQLSCSDYAAFSDFRPQIFDDELVAGNFWTEPFVPDYDGITQSGDNSLSSLHFVDNFTPQLSCEDMMLTGEFLWSTFDRYADQDYMEFTK